MQPTILNMMSHLLGCVDLGEESYVLADMSLVCWGSDHIFIVLVFAIPSLAVWIVLVPLICLRNIFRKRYNLKDEKTVLKYGFLYNGFHKKTFYWGFVKYFQKVVIILLRMSDIEVSYKMVTLLAVLVFCNSFGKFKTAYVHKSLNHLEITSNTVVLITLILTIYLFLGVNEKVEVLFFVFIFIANLYFLGLWTKTLILATKGVLIKSITSFLAKTRIIKNIESGSRKAKLAFSHIDVSERFDMLQLEKT